MTDAPTLTCRGRTLDTSAPLVMGVVNATPDSFSDRARLSTVEARVGLSLQLLDAGADLLDIGGQSGVTGVREISEQEEIDRVMPLLLGILGERPEAVISIDTYRPGVTSAAIDAGASIINDVSGLQHPELVTLCAREGCALVLMHTRVAPKKKLLDPLLYDDVTADVIAMLRDRWRQASALGLPDEAIVLDPGIDYAKTPYQSVAVLREIDRVLALGRPILFALSRKDFVGAITHRLPADRLAGTLAAIGYIGQRPGAIYRVHDVAETVDFLRVQDALVNGSVLSPDSRLSDELRREG
jgi:dihydropteroate synthase